MELVDRMKDRDTTKQIGRVKQEYVGLLRMTMKGGNPAAAHDTGRMGSTQLNELRSKVTT
jgi:hypothetical protein